jgi:hypothetical protein
MHHLPPDIVRDIGDLICRLEALGFNPQASAYDPQVMGNWYADFSGSKRSVRIIKDRSQYFVEGDRKELEPFGLWRAFNDPRELEKKMISWLAEDTRP